MLTKLVLAFVISSGISTALANNWFASLIRGTFVCAILTAILIIPRVRYTRYIEPLCGLALILLFIDSLWQYLFIVDLFMGYVRQGVRVTSFMPHPNDFAIVPLLTAFVSPWFLPLSLVLISLSQSRNALLGLVIVAVIRFPQYRKLIIVGCIAVALLVTYQHKIYLDTRLGFQLVALLMVSESPWFGKGPNTYVDYYLPYTQKAFVQENTTPEINWIPWAHSLWLEQLAERGIVGWLVFITGLGCAWQYGTKKTRAALAALMIMGIFDLSFLKPWVFGAYWTLIKLGVPND